MSENNRFFYNTLKRIALLSDTHGFIDQTIVKYLQDADEIWHAGDLGTLAVSDFLASLKPLKGVYGNVDGQDVRKVHPAHQKFQLEGIKVWMTHIGGYPGNYSPDIKKTIYTEKPMLFICGHSHILKVMPDPKIPGMLHINPGAAGVHGFHHIRTMVKFTIDKTKISELDVIELGQRASIENKNILP